MESKVKLIIPKVFKLYQRYGIKSVTMDDVAQHLGISKKTLYEFFEDKEDLVKQVYLWDYDRKLDFFLAIEKKKLNAVEELSEVYQMIKEMFRDYNPSVEYDVRKYYPALFSQFREIKRKRMFELSVKNLEKGKKEGLYRSDLNASILARLHVFRVENILESELFSVEELTSIHVFHEIFIYHLNGILSDKGRKILEANQSTFSLPD
ncbi:MAG: TetR/AcrR family transcriptional regulator [Bacteroidales bacterium]|nr:TetR/AcrR family transcriptional regulator [Bacteroidales bacterium]